MKTSKVIAELKRIPGLHYGGRKNGRTAWGFYTIQDGQTVQVKFFAGGYKHLATHRDEFMPVVESTLAANGYQVTRITDSTGRIELKVGA
jgi:hypothetical protein